MIEARKCAASVIPVDPCESEAHIFFRVEGEKGFCTQRCWERYGEHFGPHPFPMGQTTNQPDQRV